MKAPTWDPGARIAAPRHEPEPPAGEHEPRRNPFAPLYGHRWRKVARLFLSRNPLCVSCKGKGKTTAASEVDHIVAHRGDRELFWDESNWQALCKRCHARKTRQEQIELERAAGGR